MQINVYKVWIIPKTSLVEKNCNKKGIVLLYCGISPVATGLLY